VLHSCTITFWQLVARLDHTTGSKNEKPEVVFKVQKVARYASFCLIMVPFNGELSVFARLSPVWLPWRASRRRLTLTGPAMYTVRVTVTFTTGAVRSAILATAGLLVLNGHTHRCIQLDYVATGTGSRGSKCSPNKIIGAASHNPAPPIFSVLFQIFWATSHTLVIVVIAASMAVRNNSSMLPLGHPVPLV